MQEYLVSVTYQMTKVTEILLCQSCPVEIKCCNKNTTIIVSSVRASQPVSAHTEECAREKTGFNIVSQKLQLRLNICVSRWRSSRIFN